MFLLKKFYPFLFLIYLTQACSTPTNLTNETKSSPSKKFQHKWDSLKFDLNIPEGYTEVPSSKITSNLYDRAFKANDNQSEIRIYVHEFSRYKDEPSALEMYQDQKVFLMDLSNMWANSSGKDPSQMRYIDLNFMAKILNRTEKGFASVLIEPDQNFIKDYNQFFVYKMQKLNQGDVFVYCLFNKSNAEETKKIVQYCYGAVQYPN